MRKIRKLSFFGVLGVVIAVLFLISISFTQAQVQITKGKPEKPPGKPDKPGEEEVTWAVRIPTSGYMFYGIGDDDDGYYENNDANIKVSVEKNSPGTWRRYFNFVYAFDFTLTNENVGTDDSPAYQVGFQDVSLYDVDNTDDNYCQFPGTGEGDTCMADFLNGIHPHAGGTGEEDYQYFWCRVKVFDYDIESMQEGDSYLFGNGPDPGEPGDYLRMVARYRKDCFPEPTYHDVEIYRNINWFRAQDLGNPQNIEIKRLDAAAYLKNFGIECEAVWRFWVHPVGHYGIDGFLKVYERYCTTEKNKIKWYYPMEAKGCFNFYIDFIKNPITN